MPYAAVKADPSPAPAPDPHERPKLAAAPPPPYDTGLSALALVARYFHIAADPSRIAHEMNLRRAYAEAEHIVIAARRLGLKSRVLPNNAASRLDAIPLPAIVELKAGGFGVVISPLKGKIRIISANGASADDLTTEDGDKAVKRVILVTRRFRGPGVNPETFGFRWFLPSIARYRQPLTEVLISSPFLQVFALATPMFFQLVVDKVLVHKTVSTLYVIAAAFIGMAVFETILQYLRSFILSHTANRIDVELGRRLFHHLFRLPISYFDTRPTGQTAARVRELEAIRSFLTGQALSSIMDLLFTITFFVAMIFYSPVLTLIVAATIPVYVLIAVLIRPILKAQIDERFATGAASQQFLIESIAGAQTLKAASVEPVLQTQWEERLAAYVNSSFAAQKTGLAGQNLIQLVSKLTTAAIIIIGATSVISGSLTMGELIAFNMIAGQIAQPILRLSQLWQDFQQVQTSVARLGDILNAAPEPASGAGPTPLLKGAIVFDDVSMRYTYSGPLALRNVSLAIQPGETVGFVGPSGSGKSTLTKLIQRLYLPSSGRITIDGFDLTQLDPIQLRRQIGVVLQENILFNRTVHDNIALADPGMSPIQVINAARLAGAHEFISALPQGYNTTIEERGANLSGGQRQRIAIARALATNPRILIFDEATSALDYESERAIQDNMTAISQGRTVIIIAHRLAAVKSCNRIFALKDGEIVENGSPQELIAMPNGLFARLWRMQSSL